MHSIFPKVRNPSNEFLKAKATSSEQRKGRRVGTNRRNTLQAAQRNSRALEEVDTIESLASSVVVHSFVPRFVVFLQFTCSDFFSCFRRSPPLLVSYSFHHGWVIVALLAPFDAMSPHSALHLTNNNLPVGSSPSLLLLSAVRVAYPTNLCPPSSSLSIPKLLFAFVFIRSSDHHPGTKVPQWIPP